MNETLESTPRPSDEAREIFPKPFIVFADDQPEREIFPRIANLFEWMCVPDGRDLYQSAISRPGAVHETLFFDFAWTAEPDEVENLLIARPRSLVLMDVFWETETEASRFGLNLTHRLRQNQEVSRKAVFLLKTRVEGAYAEEFRRANVGYLRTFRSLNSTERCERIQFLGANVEDASSSGNYEAEKISELLLGLQEEQFFDFLLETNMGSGRCKRCIEILSERRFFGAFQNDSRLERCYVNDWLQPYFEDKLVANVPGTPLNLGPLKQIWYGQRTVKDPRKLFSSLGRDSTALKAALLRYGTLAAVENLLFTLAEESSTGEIRPISRMALDQKWNPSKFSSSTVVDRLIVGEAVGEILDLARGFFGEEESWQKLRERLRTFESDSFPELSVSTSILALIEIKGILRNRLRGMAYDLVAEKVGRLESALRPRRGIMLLPFSIPGTTASISEEERLQRFPLEEKLYRFVNRDRFLHNLPYAEKRFRQIARREEDRPEAIVEALAIDSQCPAALLGLAELAETNPDVFKAVIRILQERHVLVGLPHPERMGMLFNSGDDLDGDLDFAYFLQDPAERPSHLRGHTCSLLDLVVGGLYLLKYHIESFGRIFSWCVDGASAIEDKIAKTLRYVWMRRGWDKLFRPDLPDDVLDPLRGQWATRGLLEAVGATSKEAKSVAGAWEDFLSRFAVEQADGRGRARYRHVPPDWVRLYSLNLPLDFAPYLDRGVTDIAEVLERQRERLGVIALIKDQFRGDPFAFHERIQELLAAQGKQVTLREPLNPFSWEEDEEFLTAAENALFLLMEKKGG